MNRTVAVGAVALVGALAAVLLPSVQRALAESAPTAAPIAAACQGDHWVGGWEAAPQDSSLGRPDDAPDGAADGPAHVFTDQTLRMILSTRVGGSALRVHLGNRYGAAPVVISAATVGTRDRGASVVPGSSRTLQFGGSPSVVVPPGGEVVSDPVFAAVAPFEDLAVSFHVSGSTALDHHQWAQSTQFVAPTSAGDLTAVADGAAFTEQLSGWFGVAGVDVLTSRTTGAVVTLGDSITDGVGSSPDTDRRWPDELARRFTAAGIPMSVVNAGIAGNHISTSGLTSTTAIGPAARDRVDVDALRVAGVTDLFVFEGINDIFKAAPGADVTSALIDGYESIISRGHAAGLRVTGATITPAGLPPEKEAARLAVNQWIRTSGAYDAVVDFDAVARQPGDPTHVRPEWDAGFAHLTDPGYAAMADAIDLNLFQGTGC